MWKFKCSSRSHQVSRGHFLMLYMVNWCKLAFAVSPVGISSPNVGLWLLASSPLSCWFYSKRNNWNSPCYVLSWKIYVLFWGGTTSGPQITKNTDNNRWSRTTSILTPPRTHFYHSRLMSQMMWHWPYMPFLDCPPPTMVGISMGWSCQQGICRTVAWRITIHDEYDGVLTKPTQLQCFHIYWVCPVRLPQML